MRTVGVKFPVLITFNSLILRPKCSQEVNGRFNNISGVTNAAPLLPSSSLRRQYAPSRSPITAFAATGSQDFPAQAIINAPTTLKRVVTSVSTLLISLFLLILTPAYLSKRLSSTDAALAFTFYLTFFLIGSIGRIKQGDLAPRSKDAQVATKSRTAALLAFILAMPAFHFGAWFEGPLAAAASSTSDNYTLLLFAFISKVPSVFISTPVTTSLAVTFFLAAIALNATAAAALGTAYNRLIAPEKLITTGPYSKIQHPIYTSYILLFMAYATLLRSPICGTLMLIFCLGYYSIRAATEREILVAKFGEEYKEFESTRGKFLPKLFH